MDFKLVDTVRLQKFKDKLLNIINTNVTTINNSISSEATARDAAISSAIATEVSNRNTAISSAIATEVSNRNTAISSAIATEVSNRNTAISNAIATEVSDRNTELAKKSDTGHTHSNATTSASGFMSATDKTKLDGIATGAGAQVNADWDATSGLAQILHKPTIPAAQVNSDWYAASGVAKILNKPTIPVIDSELSQTSTNGIQNKIATLNMNGVLCNSGASGPVKQVDMPGFVLYEGAMIKVLFKNACTISYPELKVGYTASKRIVAYRGGVKVDDSGLPTSSGKWRGASSAFNEVWQPYTTLELMYDGTNWVIMGDPIIESYFTTDSGYEKKANGLIRQWGTVAGVSNKDTYDINLPIAFSNANYCALATVHRSSAGDEVCTIKNRTENILTITTYATGRYFSWVAIGY